MADLPDYLREFDDTAKTRQLIYDGCLEAVKNRFPVEDDNYRLELTDVHYDGPMDYSLEQQKQALLKSKNLRTPIKGKWRLIHKPSNTVLDEREDTVLQVPYYTNRGTVINNGNDYSIISQMRLRPGVYARRKRTGELETHFNIKPGTGRGFRFDMDPSTGVFSLTVGQSHVPLYPLLKGIGVTDQELTKSWGADIVAANARRTDAQALQKTYRRMAGAKADVNASPIAMGDYIKDAISKYEVDPEIVARTMGIETDHLTPELLVRGAQKLLDINRGDAKPDNRDNPRYTKVYAIEDLMKERIEKDAGRLSKNLLFRIKRDASLKRLPKNALNPYLDSFIIGSGLTMPGEEANPLSNLEQMTRMTRFGEGGIKSEAAVTAEARDVNGDWLGFVDPIQGPEGCNEPDTEVFTEKGWMRWDQVTEDTKFACLINGQLCFHKPEALHVYDYDGLLYCAKSQLVSYRVTKNHRLWTRTQSGNYKFSYACDQKGRRSLMVGGHEPYEGSHITTITLPKPENAKNCKIVKAIDVNDFAALLGWFISEGHVDRYNNRYRTCITQDKGEKSDEIEELLDRLPFKYIKNSKDDVSYRFEINSKQLTCYLEKLGKAYEKHIPEEAFSYPPDARYALMEAMCHGDGRKRRTGLYEYCTVSHQLALDFERLAFSLGYSSRIGKEYAKHARDQQLWIVRLHTNKERQVTEKDRFTKPYKGKVYCATVPGGLMYCRYDDYGAHWTGNSKIGVDVRASHRTFKGKDNKLYGEFTNARNGKTEYVDIGTAADRVVAFPGQDMNQPYVYAMKDDVPTKVPTDTVDYIVPSFAHMMGSNTNMNPMPTAVQGGRQFYGSKFWAQYLPQVKGQVPLVDNLMPDGKTTFSEYYGRRIGTLSSPVDGTVVAVNDNSIVVKDALGKKHTTELVNNLPFNRLDGISYFPAVQVGQDVKAGDMIANSNYTDAKTGAINMGQNLKVAIIPHSSGLQHEDAHLISESAAKRLATDRLYSDEVETRNGVTANKNKYIAAFPQKFTKQQFETLDDDGIVKVGTEVHQGDPLIVAIGPKVLSSTDAQLGKLSKTLRNAFVDKAEVWEHDWPGVVVDTAMTSRGARVNIKSTPPVTTGDKLSGRYGLKGVTAKVVSDDKMPRDAATNEPYDMLVNPMGFLSRVAPGQLMEIALGKIAHHTGKQIRLPQLPPPEGWAIWTKNQLDAAGLKDSTDIFDPETGKTIQNVGDGYMFVSAFHHLAEKKASARGAESSYTQDEQPAKGGYEGAKRMCFVAEQEIRVLHGEESIGHICDKKIPALVWTELTPGHWGYSQITDWFVRKGKLSDVISIQVNGLPVGSTTVSRRNVMYGRKVLRCTKEHIIYTPDRGGVKAGDLNVGDFVSSYGYVPTKDQMSLLYGSMLGDGCISNINNEYMPRFSEEHSHHQAKYVNWKIASLGNIVSSRKSTCNKSISGFGPKGTRCSCYTVHRADIAIKLRDEFYKKDGEFCSKHIGNIDLDSLTDVAIVAWFIDDGCISEPRNDPGHLVGSIATNSFSVEDVDRLVEWLNRRLGERFYRYEVHGNYKGEERTYQTIRMSKEACYKMAEVVAKYIRTDDIPETKKWLRKRVEELKDTYVGVDTAYTLGTVPVIISSIEPYSDGKHGPDDDICLYDITVAGCHRYCASDVLVSNSGLDLYALLAHGATDVVKDYITIRGTRNEQYWNALRLGLPIPEPGVPFIYDKFLNTLKAGGINVVEKGNITKILPLTDKDIDKLAGTRLITSSAMVDGDLDPVKGGLFDPGKTGGMAGNFWSAIPLPEPVPNPIMEEPIRRVLGLTVKQMEDVLSGAEQLDGKTGGQALKDALSKVDVDKKIAECRHDIKTRRGSQRDNAIKVLGYLTSMKEQELSPQDWMINKVPVIPPKFRPASKLGDVVMVADLNDLYKEVIENANLFNDMHKDLPDSATTEERLNLYRSVKAAYGLGESITPEGQAKGLKGAIRQVIGTSPKFGMFQRKVISKTVDTVSRSVVTPDPNLDMDQLGIPEDSAWQMYRPFVMRALVRRGYPPTTAIRMLDDRDKTAREMLEKEMEQRPVLMDRAPTWHKFNIMAFKPHIVDGDTVRVCPLVESGFNMDYDGDQNIGNVVFYAKSENLESATHGIKKTSLHSLEFLVNYLYQ